MAKLKAKFAFQSMIENLNPKLASEIIVYSLGYYVGTKETYPLSVFIEQAPAKYVIAVMRFYIRRQLRVVSLENSRLQSDVL